MKRLISSKELKKLLDSSAARSELAVFDASWFMPALNRNCEQEFKKKRVRGARFYDIDLIADTSIQLPHMAPKPAQFWQHTHRLRLGKNVRRVVFYDTSLCFMASARSHWMMRLYGLDDCSLQSYVLEGGLQSFEADFGGEHISSTEVDEEEQRWLEESNANFVPFEAKNFCPNHDLLASLGDFCAATSPSSSTIIVDARSADRFYGRVEEPRPGLLRGHAPNSLNLPFQRLLNVNNASEPNGFFKSRNELMSIFKEVGICEDKKRQIIVSCGSGVTANVVFLALSECGYTNVAVYDGSWSEYARLEDNRPVETS